MRKLKVLDLFSGIGGFSLGLERTGGFETVAFCEIEDYPRRVLAKHWPGVPIYPDVRELTADTLRRDGITVDVICGGFPCQDVSFAGKRVGLEGARSGLWREYARLIGELRPRFVIVENVPGLLNLGMGAVLGDMAALGYDATWDCIPASAVGAPHRRDRVWIIANPESNGREKRWSKYDRRLSGEASDERVWVEFGRTCAGTSSGIVANATSEQRNGSELRSQGRTKSANGCSDVAHSNHHDEHWWRGDVQVGRERRKGQTSRHDYAGGTQWSFEPDVGRVAHGVPSRVDRLKGLGNAVVPQIPELIGRAILAALNQQHEACMEAAQ